MRSSVLVSSSLQLLEVLAGPQHRVGLGHREQPSERLRQLVLLRGLLGRAGSGGDGRRPGTGDLVEHAALVGRVALDRLDQVRDEVVPAVQLDVDLPPGLLHQVPQPDEAVVRADDPDEGDHDDHDDDDQDDDTGAHSRPPEVGRVRRS